MKQLAKKLFSNHKTDLDAASKAENIAIHTSPSKPLANKQPDLSRRRLFTRHTDTQIPNLPWANENFLHDCTRCQACVLACPTQIIIQGEGGFPQVDFHLGECEFCYECASACANADNSSQSVIFRPKSEKPWTIQAKIKENCLAFNGVECRACQDSCPEMAIRFTLQIGQAATPSILDNCTACGACVSPCPSDAIEMQTKH